MGVGALWGVGEGEGVGGVLGGEADEEAADQDDGFHDEVEASSECSVEEGEEGCAIGSHVPSKGPLRAREGE